MLTAIDNYRNGSNGQDRAQSQQLLPMPGASVRHFFGVTTD
jgi:hypothetical protein